MKKIGLAFAAVALLGVAQPGRAQIPVTDVASLTQQIQQVLAWAQQYGQMVTQINNQVQQITHLRDTYNSMTGARMLGSLMNGAGDLSARRYLPSELTQVYDLYNNSVVPGFGALTARIAALRSTISTLPPGYFPAGSAMNTELGKVLDSLGAQRSMAEVAYKNSTERIPNIEALMARINSTNDPKEIAELQARIGAEQALIQNEANRIAVLQYQQGLAHREQEQRQREAFSQAQRTAIPTVTFPTAAY
jgi:type IV secretion system protein VirB5